MKVEVITFVKKCPHCNGLMSQGARGRWTWLECLNASCQYAAKNDAGGSLTYIYGATYR